MNVTIMMKGKSFFLCLFGGLLGLVGCTSHGSNASPKGNGLARIRGLLSQLIKDRIQIEFPEEE